MMNPRSVRHHRIDINGIILSVVDYSSDSCTDEPVILCLHGLTRNHRDFTALVPYLPKHYRVLVPEQRGRGASDSDPDPSNYHIGQYVDDTWQILDSLCVERVAVVGTSMGGLMAALMYSQQPRRITHAVLNDIGPVISRSGLEDIVQTVGQNLVFETFHQAAIFLSESMHDCYPNFNFNDWLQLADCLFVQLKHSVVRDYDPAIRINLDYALSQISPDDRYIDNEAMFNGLAQADIPKLLIYGKQSSLLSSNSVERMKISFKQLATQGIDHCGHAPTLTEMASVAAINDCLLC